MPLSPTGHSIPAGQLVEIAYEDLERDPIGQLEIIYEALSLGGFDAGPSRRWNRSWPRSQGYKKNRHPRLDDATREKVAAAWSRNFEVWGYPPP